MKRADSKTGRYRINVQNLGCKVNRYESDAVLASFLNAGYTEVPDDSEADVYVVNTCGVTSEAARKSRQFARRARRINPDAVVVSMGCQVELEKDALDGATDLPDLLIGQVGKSEVLQQVEQLLSSRQQLGTDLAEPQILERDLDADFSYENLGINTRQSESRAYIKVQDGCSYQCSYCTIPRARGRSRSRPAEQILEEAKALAAAGYKEAVITGVEVASWGKERDYQGDMTLIDLLEAIDATSGLERVRLSSLEPAWVTEETAARLGRLKTLGQHFHLSLQSGSDTVLRRMRRRYTTAMYREAVERLRQAMPGAEFTTDVIVGFPGETEDEHQASLQFCEELELMRLHVFRFSPRPGTDAATMPGQVQGDVARRRSQEMQALSDRLWWSRADRMVGQPAKVLVEAVEADGASGYTEHYWPVRLETATHGELQVQDIVEVELALPSRMNQSLALPTDVRLHALLL